MRRFVAGIVVTLLVLAFVAQLALPAYFADRTEQRLEQGGGRADVKLKAFPALSLLDGSGDSIEVDAEGLEFDLGDPPGDPFEDLDGFDRVDVRFDDVRAGPLAVDRFEFTRAEPEGEYRLSMEGTTTPAELAEDIGSRAGGALGGLLGELGAGAVPGGDSADVPLSVTARLKSDNGRAEVVDATGEVASIPAGPLAELVVATVLGRF